MAGRGRKISVATNAFNCAVGDWHHIIWTWQGCHHCLYLDGELSAEKDVVSHMPYAMAGAGHQRVSLNAPVNGPGTMCELGVYNFAFNKTDVTTAHTATESGAITPSGRYGLYVGAQWAPGERQVLVSADAGNAFASRTSSFDIAIQRDGSTLATSTITALHGGYGYSFVPVPAPFSAGDYVAHVTAKDSNGDVLTQADSTTFTMPSIPWLGNTLGISTPGAVQSPWTAIETEGAMLSVWGRTYTFTGGWGLPQQIISKGENLLAAPIDIDFDIGSGAFQLMVQSLKINTIAEDVVTWTGTATRNGIKGTIHGRLEYDGMVLLKLTLEPISSPVRISAIKLQTRMLADRAKYFSRAATSGQVLAYDTGVPKSLGTFWNPSGFFPSIVVSDDDRGLEWFADDMANWSVSRNNDLQSLTVDENTNIRLQI